MIYSILHHALELLAYVLSLLLRLPLLVKYIFLKNVDVLQDLREELLEISTFCSETFVEILHSKYLEGRLFYMYTLKKIIAESCNITELTLQQFSAKVNKLVNVCD